MKKLALLSLLALASPAWADANLRQRLTMSPIATLKSSKLPNELALCVADTIGESMLPMAIPGGLNNLHIFGFKGLMGAGQVFRSVSLIKEAGGTRMEVRTHNGNHDEKLVSQLRLCA